MPWRPRSPDLSKNKMQINHIVRRNLVATERQAQSLRKGGTSVCDAIDGLVSRLATLDSDELYARPGHEEGRIPAEYRVSYRAHLEGALALLVEAEDVYLRQRASIREERRAALSEG